MSVFPAMLYKSPGIHKKSTGGTYTYISVETQEELEDKLDNGWFASSADAIEAAGDKADGFKKPKPKWAIKPVKKKKPAKPVKKPVAKKAVVKKPVKKLVAAKNKKLVFGFICF
jgi:hypothetical protein